MSQFRPAALLLIVATLALVSCRVLASGEGDRAKDGTTYSQTPDQAVLVHGNE